MDQPSTKSSSKHESIFFSNSSEETAFNENNKYCLNSLDILSRENIQRTFLIQSKNSSSTTNYDEVEDSNSRNSFSSLESGLPSSPYFTPESIKSAFDQSINWLLVIYFLASGSISNLVPTNNSNENLEKNALQVENLAQIESIDSCSSPLSSFDSISALSKQRNFQCTYSGCNKSYLKSSHLKQHVNYKLLP